MTVQNPALYLQAANHPAEDFRHLITSAFGDREGVITGLGVTEKSGTPDMSVDVAEGSCLVDGTEATYQGLYLCHNRGTTNLAISASDPTNDRYDLIVAQVEDSDYSGATDAWKLAVVTGTAAATPLFPTVPDNALVLATVLVQNGVSSIVDADITDIRSASDSDGTTTLINKGYASTRSGLIICTNATRPTAGLFEGMQIWETDTDFRFIYDGSDWKLASPVLTDITEANASTAGSTSWTTVHDRTSLWTAPCAGRFVVTLAGRMGFNSSAGQFLAGIGVQAGSDPSGTALCETYAPAAKWGAVSVQLSQTFASGATMGYTIKVKDDVGSGTTHYDLSAFATFYPDNLVGGL